MSIAFSIAIYFIVWWMVLFTMLPLGVKTQDEDGDVEPGTPGSAPVAPRILSKFIMTTIVATIVFAFIYSVIVYRIIELDDIPFLPRFDPVT